MRIEHIALWARDIEVLRDFYVQHFGAQANARYENPAKQFQSYFLSFADGARLELMQRPDVFDRPPAFPPQQFIGYAHLAVSVGSEANVDALTAELVAAGITRLDGPRRTGDGYYESVVLDPEGNRIEIVA
ncbi:VOC family protein [Uliginosibacterium sp. 31-16]|uniref:VOC family protein n=1 Tax=Uliginosibacterium sp. 31-16 TaxID=3068315 RepID=UPI00273E9619|nr:VOC family protein [Uliginosibacterium sp. 31-16]MDP5239881.1 VOC family protein [Uliginosibacterium sp. 31-16]